MARRGWGRSVSPLSCRPGGAESLPSHQQHAVRLQERHLLLPGPPLRDMPEVPARVSWVPRRVPPGSVPGPPPAQSCPVSPFPRCPKDEVELAPCTPHSDRQCGPPTGTSSVSLSKLGGCWKRGDRLRDGGASCCRGDREQLPTHATLFYPL